MPFGSPSKDTYFFISKEVDSSQQPTQTGCRDRVRSWRKPAAARARRYMVGLRLLVEGPSSWAETEAAGKSTHWVQIEGGGWFQIAASIYEEIQPKLIVRAEVLGIKKDHIVSTCIPSGIRFG